MNTHPITALIVDDEENSRFTLREMLKMFCPEVSILGEAEGVKTALEQTKKLDFDVVFLDIQMMDGNGFDYLRQVGSIDFDVIFITAFDQFAIQAIKYSALDYLLKPVDADELKEAVKKVKKKEPKSKKNYDVLLDNLKDQEKQKLVLPTNEGIHIIQIDNIIRCEADDYYTRIFLVDKRMIMVSKTLKNTEELLSGKSFVRSHKSHLVNLQFVKKYVKSDGGYLELKDGTTIPVSRRKKELILNYIQNI
jgi:two-component system LytT family response regulator